MVKSLNRKVAEALLIAMKRVTSDMRLRHPFLKYLQKHGVTKAAAK